MTYLSGARAWREVAATLWLMILAAGLLATSDVDDEEGDDGEVSWSGSGPNVTLSPADPFRAFAVRLVVPDLAAAVEGSKATRSLPSSARVRLRVGPQVGESSGMSGSGGEGGEAGAGTAPAGTPWITVRMKDSSGTVTESAPVLTEWAGGTEVAFSGNCAVPDPEGVDPCVASLTVEFELQPSLTAGLREISWSVDASMYVLGFAAEGLTGTVEIHPL